MAFPKLLTCLIMVCLVWRGLALPLRSNDNDGDSIELASGQEEKMTRLIRQADTAVLHQEDEASSTSLVDTPSGQVTLDETPLNVQSSSRGVDSKTMGEDERAASKIPVVGGAVSGGINRGFSGLQHIIASNVDTVGKATNDATGLIVTATSSGVNSGSATLSDGSKVATKGVSNLGEVVVGTVDNVRQLASDALEGVVAGNVSKATATVNTGLGEAGNLTGDLLKGVAKNLSPTLGGIAI